MQRLNKDYMDFITLWIVTFGTKPVDERAWKAADPVRDLYFRTMSLLIFKPVTDTTYFPLQIKPDIMEKYKEQVSENETS